MNNIILRGVIRDIAFSHTINGVQYNKANLIVARGDGKEDVISLKFKAETNPYHEDELITISGNVRSYSHKEANGHNKVDIYVFTYFDKIEVDDDSPYINKVYIDGKICKLSEIQDNGFSKKRIHYIIANNIESASKKVVLNAYLPCISWGEVAEQVANCKVSDSLQICGSLHSREYIKKHPDGSEEFKVAHELLINEIVPINESVTSDVAEENNNS